MATQSGQDIIAYTTLGSDINKAPSAGDLPEGKQGIVSAKLPELTLDMSDDEIIKLIEKWEKKWKDSPVRADFEKQGEENEKYWLGKHFNLPDAAIETVERPQVDNLIFESLETHLPQVTRRNPDPLVELRASEYDEAGNADERKLRYVQKVKNRLADLADENAIRLKLKGSARHWALFLLGTIKVGWDLDKDIPTARVIRAKKLILDPEGTVTEDGYTGDYVGEYRKLSASRIIAIIGGEETQLESVAAIKKLVKDDLGTQVQFIEWWTKEYLCWTLGKEVLLKKKNPHWNYDGERESIDVDSYGDETPVVLPTKGINHFATPDLPYIFLSIYNLDEQPVDKTSLISQNLSNQDRINKRSKQIDKNVENMNGGMVVSLARSGLTQPQANNVTSALQRGGTVVIPDGSPREAIDRYPAPALPPDIYQDLLDTRNRLRDIFGTRGSTPAGIESEDTVRGKILNRSFDTDRIGGGISEYLEQQADKVYNWFVQLLYVYDTGFQFVPGAEPPKIKVSVKEGSLLPKDSISIANQAIELAKANRISTVDLYRRLEWPNPEELAANLWLETNAPHFLYRDNPLVQEVIAAQQQAAAAQAESEAAKAGMEHERGMEKEQMSAENKMATEMMKGVIKEKTQAGKSIPAKPRSTLLRQAPVSGIAP